MRVTKTQGFKGSSLNVPGKEELRLEKTTQYRYRKKMGRSCLNRSLEEQSSHQKMDEGQRASDGFEGR